MTTAHPPQATPHPPAAPAAEPTAAPSPSPRTLSIDCGGGGIKAGVLDARGALLSPAIRAPTPYPLSPQSFADTLARLAQYLPAASRVSVGMPGMIRHGVVRSTPHYIRVAGPHSPVDPELAELWHACPVEQLLSERLALPALVVNDADLAGAGVIRGHGVEVVLTLGTGLGSAVYADGRLAPHLEFSRASSPAGGSLDDYLGEHQRARLGTARWLTQLDEVLQMLESVFEWDQLYLGGGNARFIVAEDAAHDVYPSGGQPIIIPNAASLVGGARIWQLRETQEQLRSEDDWLERARTADAEGGNTDHRKTAR